MGKHLYDEKPDKFDAMKGANHYAREYKKGKCYTPAKEKDCVFLPEKGKWRCKAVAHHHWGSCTNKELLCGVHPSTNLHSEETIEEEPITITIELNKGKNFPARDSDTGLNDDEYTDALPEDYVD